MSIEKQIARIEELINWKKENRPELEALKKGLVDHITLMDEILQSIPEVVGVIRPDYTFAFFNDYTFAFFNDYGYEIFNKSRDQVRSLPCYQVMGHQQKCDYCLLDKVMQDKKEQVTEIFIENLGRYMEIFYKPVLDNYGEVDVIIAKMRDVTEQKMFEKQLQMQEKSYRRLFENSPYGNAIIKDGAILMANTEMIKILGYSEEELKNKSFSEIVQKEYLKRAKRYLESFKNHKINKVETELVFIRKDGKPVHTEWMATEINFLGVEAIQISIKDISKIKAEMDKASKIQKVRMEKYPVDLEKISFEMVYHPKQMVSGDFFHIFKTSETQILGFLGDSNGSGVSAALLNSAVKVIINDVITKTTEPMDFLNMIHDEFQPLFEEDFVAAICFSIDFANNTITMASAGINEYIIERKGSPTLSILKGPPIGGKIKGSSFDAMTHDFYPGDRIYVFTDGFDDDIQNLIFKEKIYKEPLPVQKQRIKEYFSNPDAVKDDILWVGIEGKKDWQEVKSP